jgi:hypothetical protein
LFEGFWHVPFKITWVKVDWVNHQATNTNLSTPSIRLKYAAHFSFDALEGFSQHLLIGVFVIEETHFDDFDCSGLLVQFHGGVVNHYMLEYTCGLTK